MQPIIAKFTGLIAHLKACISNPTEYINVFWGNLRRDSNARWHEQANLFAEWDSRTRLIAELIPPKSSVLELGAGRLVLASYLKQNCTYQPADLVKRSPDTLVFDLNAPLPLLPAKYDYAVFSGVIEYVKDVCGVFAWLKNYTNRVIFSYAVTDYLRDPITRRRNGWVNDFDETEVRLILKKSNLQIISRQIWMNQVIYVCEYKTEALGFLGPN